MSEPGREQRDSYFYGAQSLAAAAEQTVPCLYVVGGLYGNEPAMDTLLRMAAQEPVQPRIVFNGDFNWFNVDDAGFCHVNEVVLAHDATLGNVEAELFADTCEVGCGCAYPQSVDSETVCRSNQIHASLRKTCARHPHIAASLAALPMFLRYRVGPVRVCVVHGDCDSLAGWNFGVDHLHGNDADVWLQKRFKKACADVFACSHTCLPLLKVLKKGRTQCCVINNGAAGLPNFREPLCGLLTRMSRTPSPFVALYGTKLEDVYIEAIPIFYPSKAWEERFLANWPAGSPAHVSYFDRVTQGTDFLPEMAVL